MANNPYVNKVEFGGQTIVDLTGDTVEPGVLGNGYTAHSRSGAPIAGTATVLSPNGNVEANSYTIKDAGGNVVGTWDMYTGITVDGTGVNATDSNGNLLRIRADEWYWARNSTVWLYAHLGANGPEMRFYGDELITGDVSISGDTLIAGSLSVGGYRALTVADVATLAEAKTYLGIT